MNNEQEEDSLRTSSQLKSFNPFPTQSGRGDCTASLKEEDLSSKDNQDETIKPLEEEDTRVIIIEKMKRLGRAGTLKRNFARFHKRVKDLKVLKTGDNPLELEVFRNSDDEIFYHEDIKANELMAFQSSKTLRRKSAKWIQSPVATRSPIKDRKSMTQSIKLGKIGEKTSPMKPGSPEKPGPKFASQQSFVADKNLMPRLTESESKKEEKSFEGFEEEINDHFEKWLEVPLTDSEIDQARTIMKEQLPLLDTPVIRIFPVFHKVKDFFFPSQMKKTKIESEKARKNYVQKNHESLQQQTKSLQKMLSLNVKGKSMEAQKQLQYKKAIALPEEIKKDISDQNQTLDSILFEHQAEYLGTDPLQDATAVHRKKAMVKLGLVQKGKKLIKKMKTFQSKPEERLYSDPFDTFGHGIQSYFKLQFYLIFCFLFITILFVPTMRKYTQGGTFSEISGMGIKQSMGNLGHAKPNCVHQLLQFSRPFLYQCASGKMSKIKQVGLIPFIGHEKMSEGSGDVLYDFCGDPEDHQIISDCSSEYLMQDELMADFEQKCTGQKECYVDLRQFVKGENSESNSCLSSHSKVYVQYTCDFSDQAIENQRIGLMAACTGILCCFAYRLIVFLLQKSAHISFKQWDLRTVTAADWTVQMNLTEKMWQQWRTRQHFKKGQGSKASEDNNFKEYFTTRIEKQVSNLRHVQLGQQLETMLNEDSEVKIACVYFAYSNSELLKKLHMRGQHLINGKFKQVARVESKINTDIRVKKSKFVRPVAAFVTFTTQQGFERVVQQVSSKKGTLNNSIYEGRSLQLLGEKLEVMPAPETSDIIWENLEIPQRSKNIRRLVVVGVLVALLLAIFFFFTYLKQDSGMITLRYPKGRVCDEAGVIYDSTEQFKKFASYDMRPTMIGHGHGFYQCYCQQYSTFLAVGDTFDFCHQYQLDLSSASIQTNSITILISVLNTVFRSLIIVLIASIGYNVNSQLKREIMTTVFVIQFLNTGIVFLLSSANFENTPLSIIPIRATYNDFTSSWFMFVGPQIVQTMFISALMPIFLFFLTYGIKKASISMDKFRAIRSKSKTTKLTIQSYINTYCGPEVFIHYRYASIMNQIFVTFMHGLTLPLLFPICFLALVIMYITERLQFAYFYKQPPLMDNRLNQRALQILGWAPYLMFIFGYWQLGNRQIFFNEVPLIKHARMAEMSDHKLVYYDSTHPTWLPFLMIAMIPVFYNFESFFSFLIRLSYKLKISTPSMLLDSNWNIIVAIDERLGNYWRCLTGLDQKSWFCREVYERNHNKIKVLSDGNLTKLSLFQRERNCITNICNYDILSNPVYAGNYFFTSMPRRNQEFQFECSDVVSRIVYLGEEKLHEDSDSEDELVAKTQENIMMLMKDRLKNGEAEEEVSIKERLMRRFDTGALLNANFDDVDINLD